MRYARERDRQNNSQPEFENLSQGRELNFVPEVVLRFLNRTFGRRNAKAIFWLLVLVISLLLVRVLIGSPTEFIGNLPTDFRFRGSNWQIYFPLGSCIFMSFLISIIFRLFGTYALGQNRNSQFETSSRNYAPAPGNLQFHGTVMFCAVQ
jgi:uncharacterized membrane protein